MSSSYFFCELEKNKYNTGIINMLEEYSIDNNVQVYLLDGPIGTGTNTSYEYKNVIIILIPKHKICIVNLDISKTDEFGYFYDDIIDDISYLSKKYDYIKIIGRPKSWREELITVIDNNESISEIDDFLSLIELKESEKQRKADLLISLLIGSVNDITRVGHKEPENLLDRVKKKIILFDGDQTRFIFSQAVTQKRVVIQGLAGTGKTELLLHKLKELYLNNVNTKIIFTCFNKILAADMKKRIPVFFDFMRVEEQIKWEERLWVMSSWGSEGQQNTGVYSYICSSYDLQFQRYSRYNSFEKVCADAIKELSQISALEPCFDYVLIDESQDFPQSFFNLCEKVTKHIVFIAGDFFQDVYDMSLSQTIKCDYLLNKCYRTDPRTLMFAHAIGMGLYEQPVIRWLEDKEWRDCGYEINRSDDKFRLSRVPIRRFEDLDVTKIRSVKIIDDTSINLENKVYSVIDEIRGEYDDVEPGDIAIVFLETCSTNYDLADLLSVKIPQKYDWLTTKGYETKEKDKTKVFISNKNNIKGLEFPFIICIVNSEITIDISKRNTLYMMLSRSFVTSFLLVNNESNKRILEIYKKAADEINEKSVMYLKEPSKEEKENQKKVLIEASKKQQPTIDEIIRDMLLKHPDLTPASKERINQNLKDIIEEKGNMGESEIRDRLDTLIKANI